jgi:hypothetical protein
MLVFVACRQLRWSEIFVETCANWISRAPSGAASTPHGKHVLPNLHSCRIRRRVDYDDRYIFKCLEV